MRTLDLYVMIKAVTSGAVAAIGKLEEKFERLNATVKKTASFREAGENLALLGVGMAGVGAGIALPLKASVEAADELQDHFNRLNVSMGDVPNKAALITQAEKYVADQSVKTGYSQVELTESLYQGTSGFLNLSQSMAVSTEAAKLAIATQGNLTDTTSMLTTMMLNFGDATKSPIQNATTLADKMATLQEQFKFSDLNELTSAMKEAAPSAMALGIPLDQLLASLATLSAGGLGSSSGAAFLEISNELLKAAPKLGIAVFKNASGHGVDFIRTLEGIKKKFGDISANPLLAAAFEKAFGARAGSRIAIMLQHLDKAQLAMKGLSNASGTVDRGFEVFNEKGSQVFKRLHAAITAIEITIGEVLLPVVDKVAHALVPILDHIQSFGKAHPQITKYVTTFAAITAAVAILTGGTMLLVVGFLMALSYLPALSAITGIFRGTAGATKVASEAFAHFGIVKPGLFGTLKTAITGARGMLGTLGTALRTMTWGGFIGGIGSAASAVWTFTAALVANPIFLAIAAIVALGVAGYELYKHWTAVKALFNNIFGGFITQAKVSFGNAATAVSNIASSIYGGLSAGIGGVGHFISYLGSTFHSGLSSIGAYLHAHWQMLLIGAMTGPLGLILVAIKALFPQLYESGAHLMQSLASGIASAIEWPITKIKELATKIHSYLPFSPAKEGPLRELNRVRIVETIADTIKPGPMLAAIRRVAAAAAVAIPMMATVTPTMAAAVTYPALAPPPVASAAYPALAPPRSGLTAPSAPTLPAPTTMFSRAPLPALSVTARAGAAPSTATGSGGAVTVNYQSAPITINAGPEADVEKIKTAVLEALTQDKEHLTDVIQTALVRRQRKEYW